MSSASRVVSGLTFLKISNQTNNWSQLLHANHAKVFSPGGFPYEAFNSRGYIRPWSIIKLIESSRAASFAESKDTGESFLDAVKLYEDFFLFIVSTSTTMSPEMYEMSVKKAPLDIDVKLDYAGNTSFSLKTTISLQGATSPLCENYTQSVCVSRKTRKPTPQPAWWKEKYSTVKGEPLKIPRLNVPENVKFIEHNLQVQASEVDGYMHTNWSNFIKYCQNAFVLSEFLKNPQIGADNVFRNVKHFSACYIKEVNLGDNMNIRFWQNSVHSSLYHFQILKFSDVICECNMEFFP